MPTPILAISLARRSMVADVINLMKLAGGTYNIDIICRIEMWAKPNELLKEIRVFIEVFIKHNWNNSGGV